MADPVTVGAFVVSALTMSAEAALKGIVGEGAKEAYRALKTQVGKWAFGDVDKLAEAPTAGRKLVVAEVIDGQSESDRAQVEQLARALLDALKQSQPTAVGIDVDQLRSRLIDLTGLEVSNGIGLRAGSIVADELIARGMKVGSDNAKNS